MEEHIPYNNGKYTTNQKNTETSEQGKLSGIKKDISWWHGGQFINKA